MNLTRSILASLAITTTACSGAQIKRTEAVDECGENARLVTGKIGVTSGQVSACLNSRFEKLDDLRTACAGRYQLSIEYPQDGNGPGMYRCADGSELDIGPTESSCPISADEEK